MITQITDLNGTAAEKTQPLISPFAQSTCAEALGGCLACWWWTSEAVKFERKTISKIRRHLAMRTALLYMAHAVGSRGSERCEQEVVHQKPSDTTRLPP